MLNFSEVNIFANFLVSGNLFYSFAINGIFYTYWNNKFSTCGHTIGIFILYLDIPTFPFLETSCFLKV